LALFHKVFFNGGHVEYTWLPLEASEMPMGNCLRNSLANGVTRVGRIARLQSSEELRRWLMQTCTHRLALGLTKGAFSLRPNSRTR